MICGISGRMPAAGVCVSSEADEVGVE